MVFRLPINSVNTVVSGASVVPGQVMLSSSTGTMEGSNLLVATASNVTVTGNVIVSGNMIQGNLSVRSFSIAMATALSI